MNRINLFHNSKFTLAAARFRERMIETEREILRQREHVHERLIEAERERMIETKREILRQSTCTKDGLRQSEKE